MVVTDLYDYQHEQKHGIFLELLFFPPKIVLVRRTSMTQKILVRRKT